MTGHYCNEIIVTEQAGKSSGEILPQNLFRACHFINNLRPAIQHRDNVFYILTRHVVALPTTIKCNAAAAIWALSALRQRIDAQPSGEITE